jgi:colanic acid biosynthesis glycosyl transferase WcaI
VRVLVGSQTFQPDHSGIAVYANDLAAYFAENGHEVTVVTGFPFYPEWRKRPEDVGRLMADGSWNGIRVLRNYLYVPKRVTTLGRVLHELSFAMFAILGFLRAGRQDRIVVLSPPLLLAAVAVAFKYLWGARFVVHVQDLPADAALSLKMIRGGRLVRTMMAIERFVYRHSDLVITISDGMHARVLDKGVDPERLAMFPNWIDVSAHAAARPSGRFLARHPELAGKFLVAYAGNVGIKQGLDVLVCAADAARDRPDVHFLIIGDGADLPRIRQLVAERQLANLTVLPFLGTDDYFDMLADVQVSFVAQRAGVGEVFFPSKLLGIMAAGRPLLVSADAGSELARVVGANGCGSVVAAGDGQAVARAAIALADAPDSLRTMSGKARRAVRQFDRPLVLNRLSVRVIGSPEPEAQPA